MVYILVNTIFISYRRFYDTADRGSLMHPPNYKVVSGNSFPYCCYVLRINKYLHYKLITGRYVLLPQLHWFRNQYNQRNHDQDGTNAKFSGKVIGGGKDKLSTQYWRTYHQTNMPVISKAKFYVFLTMALVVLPVVNSGFLTIMRNSNTTN